jgi:hypothetical protein
MANGKDEVIGGQTGEDLMAEAASDALGDAVVLQTILSAAAKTLPPIDRAGARVSAAVDRARVLIRAAAELHAALSIVAPDAARLILQKHASAL